MSRSSEIRGDVRLGRDVTLGEGCRLLGLGGPIRVGEGTALGDGCRIVAHVGVEIGMNCRLGDDVVIEDFGPVYDDPETPVRLQGLRTDPVRVGDGVTLGPMVCLGPGAAVPAGQVVGPHVVIDPSRPVPAGSRRSS